MTLPIAAKETPGRTCWLCRHIDFNPGAPHYSAETPGTNMTLACGKGYWEVEFADDRESARGKFALAEVCADYADVNEEPA